MFAELVVHRQAPAGHLGLRDLGDQGTQPPQVAPAPCRPPMSDDAVAHGFAQRLPLVTLLHEQICAVSGSASTPRPGLAWPSLDGRSGTRVFRQGDAVEAICGSVPYSAASPISTAPSNCLPSSLMTIFL